METNNHPILLVFLSAFSRVAKLRSLLCASCYTTEGKQKSCPIMDDYLFPAPLSMNTSRGHGCGIYKLLIFVDSKALK